MPSRSRRVLMFRQYCLSGRLHDSRWIHSQISKTQMLINILSAHSKRMQKHITGMQVRETETDRLTVSDLWCVELLQKSAPPLLQLSFTQFTARRIPSTLRHRHRGSQHIWVRVNERPQMLPQK